MPTKTVIVTGAAKGIGRAIVERCLSEGFRIIACDINGEDLAALKSAYSGSELSIHTIDVADPSQVRKFFESCLGDDETPSFLVNNAGIYLGKSILDYSTEEILRVVNVNCLGAVYFSQCFGQRLINARQPGSIVNMSSVAGQEGGSDAIYSLTKAALIGLTKSCAMNFAPHIRVNAIAPALVDTDLIRNVPSWRMPEYRAAELLNDPILPEDVADTVAFLLSDQSRHYTGAVFDINNGQYRR